MGRSMSCGNWYFLMCSRKKWVPVPTCENSFDASRHFWNPAPLKLVLQQVSEWKLNESSRRNKIVESRKREKNSICLLDSGWLRSFLFERLINLLFSVICRLVLISIVCNRYYSWTYNCTLGGIYVRAYLIGMLVVLSLVIFVLILLVNRSAQGAIWDTEKRRWVGPLLIVK